MVCSLLRYLYIPPSINAAIVAQKAGVDWLFLDLEYIGKDVRQGNRDTVRSLHKIADIKLYRSVISISQLMVRVNPIGAWSLEEIESVIDAGADVLMLPYFKTKHEVSRFIQLVDRRAKTCLLVETVSALNNLDDILSLEGIDFLHIGLNDIHIERRTKNMFEFLTDGSIQGVSEIARKYRIPFGVGGVGRVGNLIPSAERILSEHYRTGSSGVILSRSFCHPNETVSSYFEKQFIDNVRRLRVKEMELSNKSLDFLIDSHLQFCKEVMTRIKVDSTD